MQHMKIAITGGAGFIGSRLTTAYIEAGHDVIVFDNLIHSACEAIDTRARFYQVDIRSEQFRTLLQLERPDVVSHHVAPCQQTYQLPGERSLTDADVHIRGLLHVLESCVVAQVSKFIFASGGNHLYGNVQEEQLPLSEDTALCPRASHDIGKIAGEWYVRYYTQHYRLPHTILRYADVYGESDVLHAHHPLTHYIDALLRNERPILSDNGSAIADHIFIDDVVRANLLALHKANNQTLHISSGRGCSLQCMYQLAAQLLESQQEPLYLMTTSTVAPAIILDNSRAQHTLGWQPTITATEGVRHAIALLRDTHGATAELSPALVESIAALVR